MSVHPLLMKHYMRLEDEELSRLFAPQFEILSQRFPKEIAIQICLCRTVEDHLHNNGNNFFNAETITQCQRCENHNKNRGPTTIVENNGDCQIKQGRGHSSSSLCHNAWCRTEVVRSRIPCFPLYFFEIDCTSANLPVSPTAFSRKFGIGVTTDFRLQDGIRRSNETAGCCLDAPQKYYYGTSILTNDDNKDRDTNSATTAAIEERYETIAAKIKKLPYSLFKRLALAVDYDNHQIILKYPLRRGMLRLDLPDHLRNRLLFPLVEARNGNEARLVRISHAVNDDERAEIPVEYGAIPLTAKGGIVYSQEERTMMARRRGLCITCGVRTHDTKVLGRIPINNYEVYEGRCIRCCPLSVPVDVLKEWEERRKVAAIR